MPLLGFLQNMGPGEWILILAVALLVFGATRIPKIARSLGRSATEFKKGLRESGDEEDADEKEEGSDKD